MGFTEDEKLERHFRRYTSRRRQTALPQAKRHSQTGISSEFHKLAAFVIFHCTKFLIYSVGTLKYNFMLNLARLAAHLH
jgi:hypothetical protein